MSTIKTFTFFELLSTSSPLPQFSCSMLVTHSFPLFACPLSLYCRFTARPNLFSSQTFNVSLPLCSRCRRRPELTLCLFVPTNVYIWESDRRLVLCARIFSNLEVGSFYTRLSCGACAFIIEANQNNAKNPRGEKGDWSVERVMIRTKIWYIHLHT